MSRKVGQIIALGERRWLVLVYHGAIGQRETAPTTIEQSTALYGTHRRTQQEVPLDVQAAYHHMPGRYFRRKRYKPSFHRSHLTIRSAFFCARCCGKTDTQATEQRPTL